MASRRARHRPPARSVAVLALVLLLAPAAACGGGGDPGEPTTTTVTATVATTTTVTAAPTTAASPSDGSAAATTTGGSPATDEPAAGVPTSTAAVEAAASGPQVFLVDARVGVHQGFDRVVWELAGGGTPGYRIGWSDDPRRDGSGDAVDLAGDATLTVVLMGVGIPPDAPAGTDVYDGAATLSTRGTRTVTVVEVGTVFEGYLTGFVGAAVERPFSVTLLRGPTRIVVDIAH